jgi:deoxyadenosine/deoxycytidine kinase
VSWPSSVARLAPKNLSEQQAVAYQNMVAVAGNLGSGKTTLARQLADILSWQVEPRRRYDESYIQDQLSSPERWTFEAQLSFLTSKVASLQAAVRAGSQFLVDRSPYEDVEVFAQYWADRGEINARSFATYRSFADLMLRSIPPPGLIVYCEASPETCVRRLAERPRPYQSLYPPDHLRRLNDLYGQWIASYNLSPVLRVDGESLDFRDPDIAVQIAGEILSQLAPARTSEEQLLLAMPELPSPPPASSLPSQALIGGRRRGGRPLVYIAAAFTGRDRSHVRTNDAEVDLLWAADAAHGIIPRNAYRRNLLAVAEAFGEVGYEAILPHRDVNGWGRKVLTPQEAAATCLELVRSADLFCGILGTSFGSHAEAATAMALGVPTVIVAIENDETFFGRGMRLSRHAVSLKVAKLEDLPDVIRAGRFLDRLALRSANR